MKARNIKTSIFIIVLLFIGITTQAQITGVVTDASTGDTLYYPSAAYKGYHIAVSGDAKGGI